MRKYSLEELTTEELNELILELELELEENVDHFSEAYYNSLRQDFDKAIDELDRRNGWPT